MKVGCLDDHMDLVNDSRTGFCSWISWPISLVLQTVKTSHSQMSTVSSTSELEVESWQIPEGPGYTKYPHPATISPPLQTLWLIALLILGLLLDYCCSQAGSTCSTQESLFYQIMVKLPLTELA